MLVVQLLEGIMYYLRCWVNGELQLALLSVVHGESLHEQRGEAGASATAKGVEDEETLQASALVSQFAKAVQDNVDNLLADGVVASGIVVGSILLAGDQLLWVKELAVCARSHLIDHSRFQVDENSPGNMLASTGLAEESVEAVVSSADSLV